MISSATSKPLKFEDYVLTDPKRLGGEPVFKGTRVPVRSLFAYLRKGITLDQFLRDFEGVTPQQVLAVLELAESRILHETRRT